MCASYNWRRQTRLQSSKKQAHSKERMSQPRVLTSVGNQIQRSTSCHVYTASYIEKNPGSEVTKKMIFALGQGQIEFPWCWSLKAHHMPPTSKQYLAEWFCFPGLWIWEDIKAFLLLERGKPCSKFFDFLLFKSLCSISVSMSLFLFLAPWHSPRFRTRLQNWIF